jgi:hypothetical protein
VQRRFGPPIRLSLAEGSNNPIDGAWWPHSVAIAAELPQLVGALDSALGVIADIAINWDRSDRGPDLDALGYRIQIPGHTVVRHRLMTVTGSRRRVILLVVPCRTTRTLAMMVLRKAAAMTVPCSEATSAIDETAGLIVRGAQHQAFLADRCRLDR